jgi:hypothetical protein
MSNQNFTVYPGKFPCKTCNEEVLSVRLWVDTAMLTWMCSSKHISRVPIVLTKKDYERKK